MKTAVRTAAARRQDIARSSSWCYGRAQTVTQLTVQSMDRRVLRRSPSDTLKRDDERNSPESGKSGRSCSKFTGKTAEEDRRNANASICPESHSAHNFQRRQ